MEVLTSSSRFMRGDESELNSAAFSWMTAVEQKEVFSMKKAFSRFKCQSVTTQSLVDSAFEKHHFMCHCFSRFRQAIYRSRTRRFRRRKLLSSTFYCWLNYNQTRPGDPVSNGTIVSACFKWISATLGRNNTIRSVGTAYISNVSFMERQDSDSDCYVAQARLIAATYPHLQPHIGACTCLHLPIAKAPLLLHATAMLDAHLLQKHFHLWRRSIQTNKLCAQLVKRQHMACLLHTSFRCWRTLALLNSFHTRKCRQQLHHFLTKWQEHIYVHKQTETLLLYCSDVLVTNCKRRAVKSLISYSRKKAHVREMMQYAQEVKLRRDLHFTLHYWHHTMKYHKYIRCASQIISQKQYSTSIEVTFGIWLLNAAKRIEMKRNANTIVINRFANQSKEVFQNWKRLSDASRRARAERDMEIKERAIALHEKVVRLKVIRIAEVISNAWMVWRLSFKAKTFSRPLTRYLNKQYVYSAFMKWNLIINLSQIANCMQKLWRGYVVRHLTHRNKTRYIRWILSGKLRTAMAFHLLMTKAKVLRHWQWFIRSSQHTKDLYSQRVVQLRNLRVMYRSIATRRKIRLANDYGYNFKTCKQKANVFVLFKQSVLWKKQYWDSGVYLVFKQLKHVLEKLNQKRMFRSNECRVLMLVRRNNMWRALTRWRGYGDKVYEHNRRYDNDTPEVFGHRYYRYRMKRKFLQLFRFRLLAAKGRRLRHYRSLQTSTTYHRRKALSRYCEHLRDDVTDRQRQIRTVRRRYLRPLFKVWHREFRRNHYYSKRIFKMQVKIMRRICKNVVLAWKLYAMKATRLEKLAQAIISQRSRSLKEQVMDKWVAARTEKVMQPRVDIVEERIDDWIKLRALRKWQKAFRLFQTLNWKSVRVTYFYWAKLVRDTKVTRKALHKAEYYDCLRQATRGLRDWHYMTVVHRNLRLWECDSRRRLLVWKARGMLQYWQRKCWWQGRRVLWSRARVLHRQAPEKRFLVPTQRTPMVNFFSTSSAFASSSFFGSSSATPAFSSHAASSFRRQMAEESMWRRNEHGPRTRTAAFVAPLAHEALMIRALRRWRQRVKDDIYHIKRHMYLSCFTAWKKHTKILAAKRAAFVNRLQLFDRKFILQHMFTSLSVYQSRHAAENKCLEKLRFLNKRHHFRKWLSFFNFRQDRSQQVSIVNQMLRNMTTKSGTYKLRLAFSTWRVFCRASPNLNEVKRRFLHKVWESWRLNYRATHFWRREWLHKFFSAWSSRVHKVAHTRSCLTHMRHAAMMVESRLIKTRTEKLRFAFDKILAHVDMSSLKTKTDWKGLVSLCRSSQEVVSPSRRRRGEDDTCDDEDEGGAERRHYSSTYDSPSSPTPRGVHSVLRKLALTSSPSSPYRTPSGSPPSTKNKNNRSGGVNGNGNKYKSSMSKFDSFLEKKTTAAAYDSPARKLAMGSPLPRPTGAQNKISGRNLDISEL